MTIKKTASQRGGACYCPKKLLLIPLFFFAVTPMQTFAQDTGAKFTLSLKKAPLSSVFKQIEAQSRYRIFYLQSIVEKAKEVTVELRGASLKEVLNEVFKDQPLDYSIDQFSILVRERKSVAQPRDSLIQLTGKVQSAVDGTPLVGATIRINGTTSISATDTNGLFTIMANVGKLLRVSYVGYQTKELLINSAGDAAFIQLIRQEEALEEVNIISSGYQKLPKERATGSFDFVDNKTFNRAVSTDLLSRLNGVANGLLFSQNAGNAMGISIRGRSTLFSNTQPLIVLDNFPYDGYLDNINPNDVESVTLLKDAAAASIWGTRAGNGVLVITTKRGKRNKKPQVSMNTNVTVTGKPDLHYTPHMNTSDYIDVERFLFGQGYYDPVLNIQFEPVSPVVALLEKQRSGIISESEANSQINALNDKDILSDMEKYLYQNAFNQQYQVNVSGGGENHSYYLSAGFDKNKSTKIGNDYDRYTFKANNTFASLNQRLQVSTDLNFTQSKTYNLGGGFNNPKYPYQNLADDNGNAVEVITNGGLRTGYTDTAGGGLLLDWKERPLDEIRNKSIMTDGNVNNILLNLNISYKIIKALSLNLYYQFNKSVETVKTVYDQSSFYTRNLINLYSQIDWQSNTVYRPIPLGGIVSSSVTNSEGNYGRVQMDFDKIWGRHRVTAIGGYEIRQLDGEYQDPGYQYGYNSENETFQKAIDQITFFPGYYNGLERNIPSGGTRATNTNRNISYYSNVGYAFDDRYLISGSFRKDKSNLFGVRANQRGVPLWSAGVGWNLHREKFYHIRWLPYLKLRLTYGYSGNVDPSTSAYLTARQSGTNLWLNPFYQIVNPPNGTLRWERVKNINVGLDFSSKDNRISGSVEYYIKDGQDLMGYGPVAPQSGISRFYGNVANTSTKGFDIKINSRNLTAGDFSWESVLIVNLNKDKVTDYQVSPGTNRNIVAGTGIVPIVGKPIYGLMSFLYAGVSQEGNPIGYLDGKVSEDYTGMLNSLDQSNLVFHGSRVPTVYGSLRNTFRYRSFEFSFNLSYKGGYFFRRQSLSSNGLIGAGTWLGFSDYRQRWQKPGDEQITTVPKLLYPFDTNRDDIYRFSSGLVESGNHLRLQDVQMSYQFPMGTGRQSKFVNALNIYVYAANLGIIWRSNNQGLDPDVLTDSPTPISLSAGIRATF